MNPEIPQLLNEIAPVMDPVFMIISFFSPESRGPCHSEGNIKLGESRESFFYEPLTLDGCSVYKAGQLSKQTGVRKPGLSVRSIS